MGCRCSRGCVLPRHASCSVVVGQDHAEVVGGGVFGAAAQLVDLAVVEDGAVFVVGFAGLTGVDVGVVVFAAAGHRDVSPSAGSGFAQDGVAGVGGDALPGSHGGGITKTDMLAQVVVVEHDAGLIGGAFGGKAVGGGVNPGHPPPVAVADRVDLLAAPVYRPGVHTDAGVIVAADDQISHPHTLVT
jgi:hypothetical protein